ncbi:MAG TPA: SDR family oxidoreductase [Burkholderiaceae bacterium]|jgi:NAD(P)-dependent dehydrogenase (short-subunit alcohol dehydrogenase family)
MKLKNKVAIIYGAGGVGAAVASAFVREGATVFLASRSLARARAVAAELGAGVEAVELDALDEWAIDSHLDRVIERAGRVDISFNAVGIANTTLQGVSLGTLDVDQFLLPITTYARSYFLTSRLAARHMVARKSGVILTVTSGPSRTGIPMMGGVAPAMSAVESLTRGLSAELAPHGVRVVGLRPLGMPDSSTIDEVYGLHAKAWGISRAQFQEKIVGRTHSRRLPALREMANAAAFAASDDASAMTGTILNLSMGSLDD